ncbi:Protein yicC [Mycetohabitans rhizoxinica HKI 454]|uniref:Protein yicC n=1 Tax=Mycetohabitans rhizoxinica (strain DSM 19002 / CIP 109453 / HKI 454) TaxID=882378 RepID=E5ANJ9_MYCRK|nr:Protein yicC [Mycetohabitans rhizoxinica HKI 454]
MTMYGIRIDIAEELSRLGAHLAETRHVIEKGGRVGKRLDFMMQELNREANTLGSKAAAKELADASMTLKLLIEQMREQVQNLE